MNEEVLCIKGRVGFDFTKPRSVCASRVRKGTTYPSLGKAAQTAGHAQAICDQVERRWAFYLSNRHFERRNYLFPMAPDGGHEHPSTSHRRRIRQPCDCTWRPGGASDFPSDHDAVGRSHKAFCWSETTPRTNSAWPLGRFAGTAHWVEAMEFECARKQVKRKAPTL